jgi:copper chaperone CopZ
MKQFFFFLLLMNLLVLSFTACKNNPAPKIVTVTSAVVNVEVVFKEAQPISMDIEGMVCAIGCAAVIQKNLNQTTGIKDAKVDFETKKATLIYDADVLSPNEVTQVVLNTGQAYKVQSFKLLD